MPEKMSRKLLHMKKEDGGFGMVNFLHRCNMVKLKKLIGAMRINNDIGKRIRKQIEVLQACSGFSINAMEINANMKFWKSQWIDEVTNVLQEHKINVGFNAWTPMKIVNEKTIMDCAWEHTEKKNEVRMLNKVRMHKKVIFLFEALGSNGSK